MYKTGIKTKLKIIQCAQKLFYEYGYLEATVKQICESSGAKLGTFTYYFNKKEDLLKHIYNSYMVSCCDYVDSFNLELSSLERHLHIVMLYYYNIYKDARIIRFHREILSLDLLDITYDNSANNTYSELLKNRDDHYSLEIIADNAVRKQLNLLALARTDHDIGSVKKLLQDIYYITARLFDVDKELLSIYIDHASEFVTRHMDADVFLL